MEKKYFTEEEKKEAQRRYNKKYYIKNRKGCFVKNKIYYKNNKIQILEHQKEYYEKDKSKIRERNKKYYMNHKNEARIYQKEYRINHKEYRNEYNKNRLECDINYKIACNLRKRMGNAITRNQKSGSAVKDLGCSIPELKTHLESKFQEGMSWKNWSLNGWHIDHIIPLDSFNLQDREEFLKACNYTNLQPLWAEENVSKKNKIIQGV